MPTQDCSLDKLLSHEGSGFSCLSQEVISYVTIMTSRWVKPQKKWLPEKNEALCALLIMQIPQFLKSADKYRYFRFLTAVTLSEHTYSPQHSACHINESFQPIDEILIAYQCLMLRLLSEPCCEPALRSAPNCDYLCLIRKTAELNNCFP